MGEPLKQSNRYELLDILKGLLIILVVLGHTNTPFTKWIYSFHMAAFFAISGFLWNEKYVTCKSYLLKFIKSRIIRLYIPFVLVNIIFVLLNNIFIKIHFYTVDASFLKATLNWPIKQTGSVFTTRYMIIECIKSFFLKSGAAPIVNTCWFLATLFIISISHCMIRLVIRHQGAKIKEFSLIISIFICLLITYLININLINMAGGIKRIFPAYAAFLIGSLLKEYLPYFKISNQKYMNYFQCIVALMGILMVLSNTRMVELSKGYIVNPGYFILGLLQGIIILLYLSIFIMKTNKYAWIKYLGVNSMSIMLFHVLSFKIVNLFLIIIYKKDKVYLASRHVIYDLPKMWSLLYLLFGISLPVCIDLFWDRYKTKIQKNHFLK